MKIRTPDNKYNILPKAYSLFPLFVALATLNVGVNKHSVTLYIISGLFGFLFIYTLFFARYDKYLDTDKKMIVTRLNWLWIRWKEEEPLSHFTSISITLGDFIAKSNWGTIKERPTYDVILVRKYTNHTSLQGMGAFENFPLKVVIKTPQEAKEFAETVSKLTGLDIIVDKSLTKFLKYDLLNSKAF